MKFKIGERVRFLNDVGEATIVRYEENNRVVVCDENGFEYSHPLAELIQINDYSEEREAYEQVTPDIKSVIERDIDSRVMKKAQDDFELRYKNNQATNVKRKGEYMEVDLHIHELIESESGLDSTAKLAIQMEHFERMLRVAAERRIKRVVIIHGVGQGVLRAEIRNALKLYYPEATFHDGSYNEYGYGATEILF